MYFFCLKSLILISSSLDWRLETSLPIYVVGNALCLPWDYIEPRPLKFLRSPTIVWMLLVVNDTIWQPQPLHFIFCKNHMPSWMHMARFQVDCCCGGYWLCLTCRMSACLPASLATFQIVLLQNFLKSSGVLSINQKVSLPRFQSRYQVSAQHDFPNKVKLERKN